MSTFDYAGMAATAGRLLSKFGQTITLTRTSGETLDPVTMMVSGGSDTDYSPKGIMKTIDQRHIDGTRILAGDRLLILDDTVEPKVSDKITINSQQWAIQEIEAKEPAGTALVYIVRVRK